MQQTISAEKPTAKVIKDFEIRDVALQQPRGNGLIYVIGRAKNIADHARFGVKIELDLMATGGARVGTASDYTATIEPGAEWRFKALVTETTVVSADVSSINEAP